MTLRTGIATSTAQAKPRTAAPVLDPKPSRATSPQMKSGVMTAMPARLRIRRPYSIGDSSGWYMAVNDISSFDRHLQLRASVLPQLRRRGSNQARRHETPNPAGDHRPRRADPLREEARLELAELRTAHEEHHVHADHPAAHRIRRLELAHEIANHHADRI